MIKSRISIIKTDSSQYSIILGNVQLGRFLYKENVIYPMLTIENNRYYFDDSFNCYKQSNSNFIDDLKNYETTIEFYKNGDIKEITQNFLYIKDSFEFEFDFVRSEYLKNFETADTSKFYGGYMVKRILKNAGYTRVERSNIESNKKSLVGVYSESNAYIGYIRISYNEERIPFIVTFKYGKEIQIEIKSRQMIDSFLSRANPILKPELLFQILINEFRAR